MKMNKFTTSLIIISLIVLSDVTCLSQDPVIDSLRALIDESKEDTTQVKILNSLANKYRYSSIDTVRYYTSKAVALAEKIGYFSGIGNSMNALGYSYLVVGNHDLALEKLHKGFETYQSVGDERGKHKILVNIGNVYLEKGDYPKSLEYYRTALEYYKKLLDKNPIKSDITMVAGLYSNVGNIYGNVGEYSLALDNYYHALNVIEKIKDDGMMALIYLNMGYVKYELNQYDESRDFYDKAIEGYTKVDNLVGTAISLSYTGLLLHKMDSLDEAVIILKKAINIHKHTQSPKDKEDALIKIANVYLSKNQPDSAKKYIKQAIAIQNSINDNRGYVTSYLIQARIYNMQNKPSQAIESARKSFNMAKKSGRKIEASEASELLYEIHFTMESYEEALKYLLLHKNYNDSLLNESKIKDIAKIQSRHEINKISQKNSLLQKENQLKEVQLQESESKRQIQQIILGVSIFLIIVTAVIIYIIYKLYSSKKKAHHQLEELNAETINQKHEIEAQAEALLEANKKIQSINESLEARIHERTKKIQLQNIKLKEYAFSNSHKVRAPIVRILGLVNLSTKDIKTEEFHQIHQMIVNEAHDLDKITSNLAAFLNKDE